MPGGGFMQDMNNKIRHNKNLKLSSRSKFKENDNSKRNEDHGTSSQKYSFDSLTEDQIQKERSKINQTYLKRKKVKFVIITMIGLSMILILFLIIYKLQN